MNLLVSHRELDMAGYDMLQRLSYDSDFNIYVTFSSERQRANIGGRCIALSLPEIRSKVEWQVIKLLRRYVRQYAIDVIFSPGSAGLSNALLASIGTSARNVGYRGTQAKVRRSDPTYYLGILNPRVRHIVCETEDIREYLQRFIAPNRLSVNLKPFDVDWVKEACQHPVKVSGVPSDAVTCVYVGCCKGRPFKGLQLFIEAFGLIADTRAHMFFVGDCDDADIELARKSPAADRIHLEGFQTNALAYLPGAHIFVLPSLRDASPRVVREAMACGLPCVVSNIPGARDLLLDGETGLLFRSGDAADLAAKLQRLIADEKLRQVMGQAGRQRIIRDFKVDDYVNRFRNLFLSLK